MAALVTRPELLLELDPRRAEVEVQYQKLRQSVLIWEVVGGGKDGGIVVRDGPNLQSSELRPRLKTGSLVRELAEKGERICYQLLSGAGPPAGWVSIKVKKTEMLVSVSQKPSLTALVQQLVRRLAMLPVPLHKVLSFPIALCQEITEKIYDVRQGSLARLAKSDDGGWLRASRKPSGLSGFDPSDALLRKYLAEGFEPLQRCFPTEAAYLPSMDAVTGLMPDAVSVVYFAPAAETLRGLVRFGAQATQSMSRGEPEEDGEFFPGVHGGAIAMVLADAAVYFARISWKANAMLKKISVQFSKPCFAFETLELVVTFSTEESNIFSFGAIVAKVSLKSEQTLCFAEAHLESFPARPMRLPAQLPRCVLAPPGVDWVPSELTQSRLPSASIHHPYKQEEYLAAAFDLPCMRFPKSCAAVEELGREEQERQRGRRKHVRANVPARGGEMRNDLCFPGGLTPAAISFEKYYVKEMNGISFEGILKLGPQASEALFLAPDGNVLDGSMLLVAHSGMALAALDDHLAHLPRCDGREKISITWKLELELYHLLPIGHEMDFRCYCPFHQTGAVGNHVTGEIRFEDQLLASLSAVITSRDKD